MNAKISVLAVLCALLSIGFLAGPAPAQPVHIHFFVVPTQAVDGVNHWEAMEKLKAKLVELAGGYTELGLSNGGSNSSGSLEQEYNFSFMVSASRDITADLEAFIPRYFATARPFILHWTGENNIPASR